MIGITRAKIIDALHAHPRGLSFDVLMTEVEYSGTPEVFERLLSFLRKDGDVRPIDGVWRLATNIHEPQRKPGRPKRQKAPDEHQVVPLKAVNKNIEPVIEENQTFNSIEDEIAFLDQLSNAFTGIAKDVQVVRNRLARLAVNQ